MFLVFFILFLAGCKLEPVVDSPTTTTTMIAGQPNLAWKSDEFTKLTTQSVDKNLDLVSTLDLADGSEFCPNYKKLNQDQRKLFFSHLISIMSKFESNHDPKTNYPECSKKSCPYSGGCFSHPTYGFCMKGGHKLDNGVVISRGLLQISMASALGYGCDVSKPTDLNDPAVNLDCATRIMARLMSRDKRIAGIGTGEWRGGARYWAVLRNRNESFKVISVYTKTLPMCQK